MTPRRKTTKAKKVKRGYSRAFTPRDREKAGRYLLDKIPAGLWRDVKSKAKREGVSLRALLLDYLSKWLEPAASAPPVAPAGVDVASQFQDTGLRSVQGVVLPPVSCEACQGTGQVTTTPGGPSVTCTACGGAGVVPAVA